MYRAFGSQRVNVNFFPYPDNKKCKSSDRRFHPVDSYCDVELKTMNMVLLKILNVVHNKTIFSYKLPIKIKT